ncbi:hypothetical protein [Streptomyces sp. NPDC001153]
MRLTRGAEFNAYTKAVQAVDPVLYPTKDTMLNTDAVTVISSASALT